MAVKSFSRGVVTPVSFQLIREKTSSPLTQWMNGFTTDVSLDGVKITAPMSDADVETLVRQYALIKLSFQLPGTAKAIDAIATIAYFVRGAAVSPAATITFGVSFVAIDYSARDVIGEFILRCINCPAMKNMYLFPDKKMPDARRRPQIPCAA